MNKFSKHTIFEKLIFLIVLGVIFSPFLITILFSCATSDDFSMARGYTDSSSVVLYALETANHQYMTWGGGWPFTFLQCVINPIILFGPASKMYGVELVFLFILFVVVLYFFINCMLTHWFKINSKTKIYVYFCLFIFCFLNTAIYTEIFYWFVGNSYLWEVTFCLLNSTLIILYFRKYDNWTMFCLLSIVGFVSCFGYQVAMYAGMVYIIELYFAYKRKQTNLFIKTIPLIFMIAGGCLSCFAPGNFTRHNVTAAAMKGYDASKANIGDYSQLENQSLGLKGAFLSSLQNCIVMHVDILVNPFCIAFFGFSLFVGFKNNYVCKIHPLLGILIQSITIFFTLFPVALGYENSTIPNRVLFYVNIGIFACTSFNCIVIASYLSDKYPAIVGHAKNIVVMSTCVIVAFGFLQYNDKGHVQIKDTPWVYTAANITTCRNDSAQIREALCYINDTYDHDVKVSQSKYLVNKTNSNIIKPLVISKDVENWENVSIAQVFDKDTIQLVD